MKPILLYLIETLFCSGLFLVLYRLLLSGRVAFGICRRYLWVTMAAAMVIPALRIPIYPATTVYYSVPLITAPGEYTANGKTMSLQEVEKWLTLLFDKNLSCTVEVDAEHSGTVVIDADPATEMRAISDLETTLRKAGIQRVIYHGSGVPDPRYTHPSQLNTRMENGVEVITGEHVKVKSRNLFVVNVNRHGDILAGTTNNLHKVDLNELKTEVKTFLVNADNLPGLSEHEMRTAILPDGMEYTHPTSRGMISLQPSADLSYERYLRVQEALVGAVRDMQDDISHQIFGKPFDKLSADQAEIVWEFIPLPISKVEPKQIG